MWGYSNVRFFYFIAWCHPDIKSIHLKLLVQSENLSVRSQSTFEIINRQEYKACVPYLT